MKKELNLLFAIFLIVFFQACTNNHLETPANFESGNQNSTVELKGKPTHEGDFTPSTDKDSLALIAIYNATQGDYWTKGRNWTSKLPLERWQGVKVERVNGERRVVELNLAVALLKGSLPKEIRYLTKLKKLVLLN